MIIFITRVLIHINIGQYKYITRYIKYILQFNFGWKYYFIIKCIIYYNITTMLYINYIKNELVIIFLLLGFLPTQRFRGLGHYQTLHFPFGFILLDPSLGQDQARANFSLLDNGPITLNLSGACSSLITWLRIRVSVWTAHQGNAYPK